MMINIIIIEYTGLDKQKNSVQYRAPDKRG